MKPFITQNKKYIRQTAILFVWLLLWQILCFFVKKQVLVPSPLSVGKAFLSLCREYDFWLTLSASLCRILTGYVLCVLLGVLSAVFCHKNKLAHAFFQPAIQAIKATPVVSFSILVLLWVKTDWVPVVISFLMVFPIIWTNTMAGISQTQAQYLEMAKAYGFSPFKTLRYVYVPSVLPYFVSASHTGIGMAWKAGIAAEVICTPAVSMGKKIYETKIYLETPQLFVWTICAIALSMVLEKLFLKLLHHISKRMGIFYEPQNNTAIS